MKVVVCLKGGKGSGHHGHSGRPGMVGGSSAGKGSFVPNSVYSDTEAESLSGARELTASLVRNAETNGYGDEMKHWTGNISGDEYDKFKPKPAWTDDVPEYIPSGQSPDMFPRLRLSMYYENDAPTQEITKAFRDALDGKFGERHQKAAQDIRNTSIEVFKHKFGNSTIMSRADKLQGTAGDAVIMKKGGISVSEKSASASTAAQVFRPGEVVTTSSVLVKSSDVLFGHRVIPSPYPEREWVVTGFIYQ